MLLKIWTQMGKKNKQQKQKDSNGEKKTNNKNKFYYALKREALQAIRA